MNQAIGNPPTTIVPRATDIAAAFGVPHPFDSYLFGRGYLFATGPDPVAPTGWHDAWFSDFHLRFDPRLGATRRHHGNTEIVCLGILFDPREPERATGACVDALSQALASSEERFLEELAFTCGRYVIAYQRLDGVPYLITDATGMKPAFYYARERRLISSHVNLAAYNAQYAGERPTIQFRFGYPGIRTPRDNIFLLTPNTKLNLRMMRPERFWPRLPIDRLSVDDVAEKVRDLFQGAYAHIAGYHRPLVSVTAGIDSRVTLAISKNFPGTKYFTYHRSDELDTDRLDRDFGLILKHEYRSDHDILDKRACPSPPRDFARLLQTNTFYRHIRSIAYAYFDLYRASNYLHVRSNIGEVGRQFYGRHTATRDVDLARIWIGKREYPTPEVFSAIEAFTEFAETTSLFDCARHVDLKSLFYWEFRMSAWHSQVLVESDPSFDTVSLYNCRRVLELLLSVPEEDQKQASVLKAVIRASWAELTGYPVNGKAFSHKEAITE